jgi:DNA-binding NarL/FixJ family response regulator
VLLVENVGLIRAGLRALLHGQDGVAIVGAAAADDDVAVRALETRPDVVLIDADLPGLDATNVTRQILAHPAMANVSVLIMGEDAGDEQLIPVLRAGAAGYLLKRTDPVELVAAIRIVGGGGGHLSPAIARRVIAALASMPEPANLRGSQLSELTLRQREVLTLVAIGQTNSEIAERLMVSPATAKTHVSRIMGKVGTHSRAELVTFAYQCGLVVPDVIRLGPEGSVAQLVTSAPITQPAAAARARISPVGRI